MEIYCFLGGQGETLSKRFLRERAALLNTHHATRHPARRLQSAANDGVRLKKNCGEHRRTPASFPAVDLRLFINELRSLDITVFIGFVAGDKAGSGEFKGLG